MLNDRLTNRINAPIDCPLKMSTIVWSKCEGYRKSYGCLCKEARDRLKIKGEGKEAFQAQLHRIKEDIPDMPEGWKFERKTRFYMVIDDKGEVVHRATNQKEAMDYLRIVAELKVLRAENQKLWALLRDELIDFDALLADQSDD